MTATRISDQALAGAAVTLEDAWPGVRVERLDYVDGDNTMVASIRGTEAVMLEHGLVTAEQLAAIPAGGDGWRGRLAIGRRKRWTRLELTGDDAQHAAADRLEGRILAVLLADVWRPGVGAAR